MRINNKLLVFGLILLLLPIAIALDNGFFLRKAHVYNDEFANINDYSIAVKSYNKNYTGAVTLEINILDNGSVEYSETEELTELTPGEKIASYYNIDISAYEEPLLEVNYLDEDDVYLENNSFDISEILDYYDAEEPYSIVFTRNKDETTTYDSFDKSLTAVDGMGYLPEGAEHTVDVYLDSMTVDEDDKTDSDCSNSYEDVYWDDDYSSDELRAIFALGFPSDYRSKVPADVMIVSATFYVWYDEEYDSGKINQYISYTKSDQDCDGCMDWDEAFYECDINDDDKSLGSEYTDDDVWRSFDVTSELRSAYENNRYVAFWMRGSTASAGDDVEQDFAGEGNSRHAPYVKISYKQKDCISGVCCDNGIFRPSSYVCQSNVGTEYGCPWGTSPGNDVGVRYENRYCTGSSANCDGRTEWADWQFYADCNADQYCIDDNPNCNSCGNHNSYTCYDNDVYWYDNCNNREDKKEECESDYCDDWGSNYCNDDGNLYHSRTCYEKGCTGNSCYNNDNVNEEKAQDCQYGCENNACVTPDCTSGACCDTSTYTFRASSYKCQGNAVTDYGCPWGTSPGDDVGLMYSDRYCSGSSADCDGEITPDDWQVNDDCSSLEVCVNGDASCHAIACNQNSDCGQDGLVDQLYCEEVVCISWPCPANVVQKYRTYGCLNPSLINSQCTYDDETRVIEECAAGCEAGTCVDDKPPVLVSGNVTPAQGITTTEFVYRVVYIDDIPLIRHDLWNNKETVWAVIDDNEYLMELILSGDLRDYCRDVELTECSGDMYYYAVYEYKTKLSKGEHDYYFRAMDNDGQNAETNRDIGPAVFECLVNSDCNSVETCFEDECIPDKPLNPFIEVNGVNVWSYSGFLDSTQTVSGFESALNNALEECEADSEGYCDIPIVFSSDAKGSLTISRVIISYTLEDEDNDGIADEQDRITGDIDVVDTNIPDIQLVIDDSEDINQVFEGEHEVEFKDNTVTILEFTVDLNEMDLDLNNVVIQKQDEGSDKGSLIVSGVNLPQDKTKTVYIDNINSDSYGVCVKDAEISSINEITGDCTGSGELYLPCKLDLEIDGYKCEEENGKYKVTGLKHSGIVESDADDDNDGVEDSKDKCPSTKAGEDVNTDGCSCTDLASQIDDSNDCTTDSCSKGIISHTNKPAGTQCGSSRDCPADTCVGEQWYNYPADGHDSCNANGQCSEYGCTATTSYSSDCDTDDDNDNIEDSKDKCPSTKAGEYANTDGCSCTDLASQIDDSNDCTTDSCSKGIISHTNKPAGTQCGSSRDCPADTCIGEQWYNYPADGHDSCNANGQCSEYSCTASISYNVNCDTDDDNDKVPDDKDKCPSTKAGEDVNTDGCSCTDLASQIDDSNDCTTDSCSKGIISHTNKPAGTQCGSSRDCPADTCIGEQWYNYPADGHDSCNANGQCSEYSCTASISYNVNCDTDDDNDKVPDDKDKCPSTKAGEDVNTDGCSCRQKNYCIDDDLCTVDSCDPATAECKNEYEDNRRYYILEKACCQNEDDCVDDEGECISLAEGVNTNSLCVENNELELCGSNDDKISSIGSQKYCCLNGKWNLGICGDFDNDGCVKFPDFIAFAQAYGKREGEDGYDIKYDLSNNNVIDFEDFIIFAADYDSCA